MQVSTFKGTKERIKSLVNEYIKLFPEEYIAFCKGTEALRQMAGNKFALLEGSKDTRILYEMPETLHTILTQQLTVEELHWLKAGGKNGHDGGRWFAKTFPTFRIARHI
jgi:hypothetical protein